MNISEEEYIEYEQLKEWAKKQKVYQSAKDIIELKDDIDLPIRKCVAMAALLGCEPIFSCCGFDYDGQPFHKSHQYRQPYIKFRDNIFTTKLQLNFGLILMRYGWSFRSLGGEIVLELLLPMNPHWEDDKCIHSSEECVIGIAYLEKILNGLYDEFQEEVIVTDTNQSHKRNLKFWQYPPKNYWIVRKLELEQV